MVHATTTRPTPPPAPLPGTDITRLQTLAHHAALDAVHCSHPFLDTVHFDNPASPTLMWTLDSTEGKITVFKGHNTAASDTWTYCAVADLHGSVNDVAALFHPSKHALHVLDDVVEPTTLYTLAASTPEFPHHMTRVTWFAASTPGGAITKDVDFCALECHRTFDLPDHRRGWVRVVHSIEMPEACPPLPGYTRADLLHAGVVVVPSTRPGFAQLVYFVHLGLQRGGVLPLLVPASLKKRCLELVVQVDRLLHLDVPGTEPRRQRRSSVDKAKACVVCQEPFGLFGHHRRVACHLCGQAVCSRAECAQEWHTTPRAHELYVCHVCLTAASPRTPIQVGVDNGNVVLGNFKCNVSHDENAVVVVGPETCWDLRLSAGVSTNRTDSTILLDLGVDEYKRCQS
ncbi:Aste57867_2496 [Aphanomyces stellatus]|uniref:Aste57867_2496 protein n=1 Tax=Aphanomyces stellatus TaxID=120398 RepID=A0A485K8F3_9STRA|nr:hypothetical protein As57867_002489 [Aphanomyces stellatus]VFT79695.1 Aste57867_2496 [Aphanomyces stellatus]